MTIAALPSQTVRAIGSTQALTDAASVVKELVDNALDAQSTSITVEISTNTLDIIQVRDNGRGIAPIDRPLLCKRYCTSKIKDLDDLATIGGASLGFRGEALASAVELSGGLTVTTRIVGEATAISLKVGQNGEVINEERVSHAVGTTVRISDFLKTIPVRQQTALKDSAKQLAKIKRTLQAYALARPFVRLSLKVFKSKTDKGNWIYGPKSDASVLDAAVKVVGKKVTDECQWLVWDSSTSSAQAGTTQGDGGTVSEITESSYRVEALMPKPDAVAISSVGQYVSVDSRPVSCARGTLKQIMQLYKSYIRSACSTSTERKLTDPFLCMNLVCPPGSYDANVEPAKDDVLFSNSPHVLEVVEVFLKSQYGNLQSKAKQAVRNKPTTGDVRNFDLLLARKPPQASSQTSTTDSTHQNTTNSPFIPMIDVPASGNSGGDRASTKSRRSTDEVIIDQIDGVRHWVAEESREDAQSSPAILANSAARSCQTSHHNENEHEPTNSNRTSQFYDSEDEDELRDINVSNPWTFAKLNAPIHPQRPRASNAEGANSNQQLLTPAKQYGNLGDDLCSPQLPAAETMNHASFPTPARSQHGTPQEVSSPDPFPYPMKRWGKAQREANSRKESSPDEERSSPTRLDTWIQRSSPNHETASQESSPGRDELSLLSRHGDFLPASELPQGTPLSAIPDISQAPRRKAGPRKQQYQGSLKTTNKPFKPPAVQDPTRVWFDHLENPSGRPSKPNKDRTNNSLSARSPNGIATTHSDEHDPIIDVEYISQHPALAQTMEYETRKAAATAQRRAFLRQQSSSQFPSHQSHLIPSPEPGTQIKISPSQASSSPFSSSPHKNRYNSAIAALHTPPPSTSKQPNAGLSLLSDAATTVPSDLEAEKGEEDVTKIHPKDPRAYLMQAQKSDGRTKSIQTGLLPLERLSTTSENEGECTRNLTQILDTGTLVSRLQSSLSCSSSEHASCKHSVILRYNIDDEDATAFEDVSVEEVKIWEKTLIDLLHRIYPGHIRDNAINIDLVDIFTSPPSP
ncbi:MAG: hypothetical protein Q9215_003999 [Flavoplaca cf. flavocitrina]